MNLRPELGQLLAGVASMETDLTTSTGTIVTSDGNSVSFPLPSPLGHSSCIVRTTFDPNANILTLETDRGDTIVAELPSPADSAPLCSRPIVYLDQNHWSLLA